MREQLTRKDVEKIEQEIEHRKLVVRKEAIEAVKLLLMQLHSLFHICSRQAPGRWWNPHRRLQVQVLS